MTNRPKDKPTSAISMQDVAHQLGKRDTISGKQKKLFIPTSEILGTGRVSDEDEKLRVEYNKKIKDHLPEYANFVPLRKVLVRCYVMEYYDRNGIMIKPVIEVPVKTQNGMAIK